MSATVPLTGTSCFPGTHEGTDSTRVSNELTEAGTSRDIQTKKWRFHFNDAGAGHPLVFLHGSGPGATGWTNFRTNLGPLSQRHRVLAVDMPGWGQSDSATPDDRDHLVFKIDVSSRQAFKFTSTHPCVDRHGVKTTAVKRHALTGHELDDLRPAAGADLVVAAKIGGFEESGHWTAGL